MAVIKTRCRQCVNADKKANEKPCSQCSEIQFIKAKFENQFQEVNKNLIKGE